MTQIEAMVEPDAQLMILGGNQWRLYMFIA